MFGETIFTTILEVLADIAPLYQGGMGPLKAMAQHAVHDREAATARFYLYLSDVFFYDTQDMYMFPYSDFILAIMLCYMTPMDTKNSCFVSKETRYDGLIDFKQMSESVQIEETMVDWFVRFLEEAAASFQAYLATLIYTHQGGVMTWAQLRSHLKTNDSCAAEIDPSPLANGSTLGVYNHSVSMWSDLFRIALESEENKTKIRGFLQEVENRCQASFLKTWHPDTEELCLREFVQRKLAGLF